MATPQTRPASWTDNINYDNYDPAIEDRFRKERNYLGLADYLSKFRMNNPIDQSKYDSEISQLRRYGRQYNAMQRKASDTQRDAISFLSAYEDGDLNGLGGNFFGDKYLDKISELGRKDIPLTPVMPISDITSRLGVGSIFNPLGTENYISYPIEGNEASNISVRFNNRKTNYLFGDITADKKGMTNSALGSLRALVPIGLLDLAAEGINKVAGTHIPEPTGFIADLLSKDEDKDQFSAFCEETDIDEAYIKSILGDNCITNDNGATVINIPKSNLKGIKLLTDINNWKNNTGRNSDDVFYAGYDTDNQLTDDDQQTFDSRITNLSNIINAANNSEQSILNSEGQEFSTTILPYMNEHQMRLNIARDRGLISESDFKARMANDNEIYKNLLLGTSFSQLDIYTDYGNDEGVETLHRMENNNQRGRLKDYIRNAIDEDRVSWRAAISGGEYGTYLIVSAKETKGVLKYDEDDARRGMTIFIPGLFTKSIQNAFNSSTEGKTVAEINSMQQYGYEYNLPSGDILSNVGNNGATLYDKNTGESRYITREEAHNMLHEAIIEEDATINIRNRMFNNDGTVKQNYDYESDAKKIALAAANEIYPGSQLEENNVWFDSDEDRINFENNSDNYTSYKKEQCSKIYTQIMNNIYKLLNISN